MGGPIDRYERIGREEFARLAIQHIEEAIAIRMQQRRRILPADLEVGQNRLIDTVVIPHVTWRPLIAPGDLTARGVRQRRSWRC